MMLSCDFCSKDFPSQDGSIICPDCLNDLDDEDVWEDAGKQWEENGAEAPIEGV